MSVEMSPNVQMQQLLSQMREIRQQAMSPEARAMQAEMSGSQAVEGNNATKAPGFGEMFANAINSVNEVQQEAGAMRRAFERGDEGVDLTRVMVAAQKSSIAFEATMQVRNKLVEAYKDVMNMPI